MKQIVLDTETTGLEANLGHRIIEIAAIEVAGRQVTDNHFHHYINPEREIDAGAAQVHGITEEMLQDKPKFADIAQEFLDFVSGAELIIHNAPFDVGFLNSEFDRIGLKPITEYCRVTDTLKMARDLHPGKRNNLDALCERYEIDKSKRTLHGALIDAGLLADVYLAMTRGQGSLTMDVSIPNPRATSGANAGILDLKVIAATEEELAAHAQYLAALDKESKGACLWKKLESA